MNIDGEDKHNPILSVSPPEELIPQGYTGKVIVMWLSFLGIFLGVAGMGTPFVMLFPLCLAAFLFNLSKMLLGKAKDKPIWLYKEAQEYYHRGRYDKALNKLNFIIELKPEIEDRLLPAVLVCKNRTKDCQGAADCCNRLLKTGKINAQTNPVLLMEMLSVLKKTEGWEQIEEIAANLPDNDTYTTLRGYY